MFIPQAQPHAQSLFLFPIVFGINLIHFFRIFRRERRTVQPEIRSFALLLRSPVNYAFWQCEECEPFRKVQRFWQRKVWREKLRCNFFGKEKRKTRRRSTKVHIFGKEKCKTQSPILARQWWRHFRLSLSVSLSLSLLSLSLSHRMYLTHNIGNASAFPIIAYTYTYTYT